MDADFETPAQAAGDKIRTMPFYKAANAFGDSLQPGETTTQFVHRVDAKRRALAESNAQYTTNQQLGNEQPVQTYDNSLPGYGR